MDMGGVVSVLCCSARCQCAGVSSTGYQPILMLCIVDGACIGMVCRSHSRCTRDGKDDDDNDGSGSGGGIDDDDSTAGLAILLLLGLPIMSIEALAAVLIGMASEPSAVPAVSVSIFRCCRLRFLLLLVVEVIVVVVLSHIEDDGALLLFCGAVCVSSAIDTG